MSEVDRLFGGMHTPVSRRELLRRAGRGSAYLGAMAILAACGVQGERREQQELEPLPPAAGDLVVANWPLYIDKEGPRSPTVLGFEEEFDTEVKYNVVINDNEEFFGVIHEPLSQGQPTPYDVIVITDWMVAKMIGLGYLEKLHHERLANFGANAQEKFKDPWYDPGNAHSVPYAAGITGIGYDITLTGREITSVSDLFDPEFGGRVGLFSDMRDTFGLVLAMMGIREPDATVEDVEKAQQFLMDHRDQVRGFYGNNYVNLLGTGSLALSVAWSGDVFFLSLDNPNLRFVVPEEGGMRWIDNMTIPAGAAHQTDAHEWMNYLYRPDIAQQITEWVWYESPVAGLQERILEHAERATGRSQKELLTTLGNSPLVFPSPEALAAAIPYKRLDPEEEEIWNDLFQEVTQG